MPRDYSRAFALIDNPFGPTKLIKGVKNRNLMKMLVTHPLRIFDEPKLRDLYCPKAGMFERNMSEFKNLLEAAGYSADPLSAGLNPFLFLITGYKGSGKTTLVNIMLCQLQKCKADDQNEWRIFQSLPEKESNTSDKQIDEISELEKKIISNTRPDEYCCAVIDNLVAGAEPRALEMYDNLNKDRIAFLFLATSDLQILNKSRDNSRHQIHPFRTRQLMPQDGIEFVKHRISYYRDHRIQFLKDNSFFPFDECDIRESVETGVISEYGNGEGIITLRQFGVILERALRNSMFRLDENFDISHSSEAKLPKIRIIKDYERMVA